MKRNHNTAFDVSHARKVLMVSHAFPPTGGSGVQRSAKFAKYLPRFGWLPIVWASDRTNGLPVDASLESELPASVRIIRDLSEPGMRRKRPTLRGLTGARSTGGISRLAARLATAVDWRLKAMQAANAFPDDCVAWARASLQPTLQLIEAECVEAIYSTYSPVSNHTLAMALKREAGLPWIADFRDLWTDDPRYREPSPERRASARRLEQQILESADVVVAVTPIQRDILASRVPGSNAKFVTITNGYDPADFVGVERSIPSPRDRFVLAHVGRLDEARTQPAFFAALAVISKKLGAQKDRFVLRVVGHCNEATRAKLEGTGICLEIVDYVPHFKAIEEMIRADALLALLPTGRNAESIICGKLFEYLATGRPILVIGPKGGQCQRIVEECHAGIATPFDESAIVNATRKLFEAWQTDSVMAGRDDRNLRPYSRISTTRKLATILDTLSFDGKRGDKESIVEVASAR